MKTKLMMIVTLAMLMSFSTGCMTIGRKAVGTTIRIITYPVRVIIKSSADPIDDEDNSLAKKEFIVLNTPDPDGMAYEKAELDTDGDLRR